MIECKNCGLLFRYSLTDLSHNIPKYMGGTDKDGRTRLCKPCHREYDIGILDIVFNEYLHIELRYDLHTPEWYMSGVKELPEDVKIICREKAKEFYLQWKQ